MTSSTKLLFTLIIASAFNSPITSYANNDCLKYYRDRYVRSHRTEDELRRGGYGAMAISYAAGVVVPVFYTVGAGVGLATWMMETIERNQKSYFTLREAFEAVEAARTDGAAAQTDRAAAYEFIQYDFDSTFRRTFRKMVEKSGDPSLTTQEIANILHTSLTQEKNVGPCVRYENQKGKVLFHFMTAKQMREYVEQQLILLND